MPLLRKQPFHRQKIPHDLRPEEEVFHCKITNEIFRNYNAFFERIILCNSLVWSCAITGKSGMTFQEAEESEEKAKRNLANFQDCLKRPLLFLATLTHRSRLNDMNDDIFMFAKDRYFHGETLECIQDSERISCKVITVIPPQEEKSNGDIIVIDDSDEDSNQGGKSEKKKKALYQDYSKYSYVVKLSGQTDTTTATPDNLSRKRGLYSRDRSKLFLKQHCDPVEGLWKVKQSYCNKYGLMSANFKDYFAGPKPVFEVSQIKRKKNTKRSFEATSSSIEFEEPPANVPSKVAKINKRQKVAEPQVEHEPMLTQEERALLRENLRLQKLEEKEAKREEMRRQIDAEKIRRKEERDRERIKKMEEKKKEVELYREWAKPRDDLECEDLKEMPEFIPVRTRIQPELFGDAAMILEFAHVFKTIFDFKQFFPKGFTWVMMESALMDHEPDGPLCDLLQMLLCALFNLQEEEAEEYEELRKEENVKNNDDKEEDMDEELSTNELIRSATVMAQHSQNTFGMPLRDTLLDQFTLSEILRIHILASGAKASAKNARFRYQQRGGYTAHDDPGLELKMDFPAVLKILSNTNIFDLTPANKVKLIDTLVQQILTYAMVRDMIEEASEKLRVKKYDLKQFQWAELRREKEEQATKYKKILEERAKEQAKRMQQLMAEHNGVPTVVTPVPDMVEKTPEEKESEKKKEHEMETRKKSEFYKKECDMLDEIMELQRMVSVCPIGRDRLYRRYYYFSELNSIFIEDHEVHIPPEILHSATNAGSTGTTLKLLPQLTFQGEEKRNGKTKANGNDCIVISDEENGDKSDEEKKEVVSEILQDSENDTHPKEKGKVLNSLKTEVKGDCEMESLTAEKDVKDEENSNSEKDDSPPVLESESSIPESHNPTWSFIDTPELLDALVNCLNTRGYRESLLKASFLDLKSLFVRSLKDCPTDMLSLPEDGGEEKARIQALALTRGISSKKAAQDALMKEKAETTMELNLRDALLDMEDRIHIGSLGCMKVKDRASWRKAILSRHYDPQTNNPIFSPCKLLNGHTDSHISPDSEPVARTLGRALVQIARGVETRFLREPLREDDGKRRKSHSKEKDKKKKENGEESDEENSSGTKKTHAIYDRWEESLLITTSLSQVYLHLATLDKSIVWAKSTLETRCRLCRRKGDAEKMLLCDGCDRGHHMYCLKPPMEKVPTGDWFCPDCRPKQAPRSPIRKGRRKTFTEEETETEELENQEEEEEIEEQDQEDLSMQEEEEEEDVTEEEEEEEEECVEEDDDEVEDDEDEMELSDDPGDDLCFACKTGGTLICCDCCPRAYHLHCAKPALKKIPRGKWMCQVCIGRDQQTGKIKIVSSNKNGRGKIKMNVLSKKKEKDKDRKSTGKSTPTNSRPGSKRESPRDSPVFGGRLKKNSISTLAMQSIGGESGLRKSKSSSRLPTEPSNDKSQMPTKQPINPSSKRVNSQQQQLKAAEELINELIKHEDAWPFLKPVEKKLVPDYYEVIKEPMDFGTIRNKIHAFSYHKPSEMLEDVRRIFKNCAEYNNRSSPEYKASCRLTKHFDKRIKEKNLSEDLPSPVKNAVKNSRGRVSI